jgi:hypothetical protein
VCGRLIAVPNDFCQHHLCASGSLCPAGEFCGVPEARFAMVGHVCTGVVAIKANTPSDNACAHFALHTKACGLDFSRDSRSGDCGCVAVGEKCSPVPSDAGNVFHFATMVPAYRVKLEARAASCGNRICTKGACPQSVNVGTANAAACVAFVLHTPSVSETFVYDDKSGWCDCVSSGQQCYLSSGAPDSYVFSVGELGQADKLVDTGKRCCAQGKCTKSAKAADRVACAAFVLNEPLCGKFFSYDSSTGSCDCVGVGHECSFVAEENSLSAHAAVHEVIAEVVRPNSVYTNSYCSVHPRATEKTPEVGSVAVYVSGICNRIARSLHCDRA